MSRSTQTGILFIIAGLITTPFLTVFLARRLSKKASIIIRLLIVGALVVAIALTAPEFKPD